MKFWVGTFIFVLGVVAGVSAVRFVPASVSPYLPTALQGQHEIAKGRVVRKHQENERLLLTVSTSRGALLATFTKQIDEINLLVEEGDEVTLGLAQYAPFVHDPVIKGVMKPDHLPPPSISDLPTRDSTQQPLESESAPDGPDHDSRDPKI